MPRIDTAVSLASLPWLVYVVAGPVRKFTPSALTLPAVPPPGVGVGVAPETVGVGVPVLFNVTYVE